LNAATHSQPDVGSEDVWYGLDRNGGQLRIRHCRLMDWALRTDEQFQVGWSYHYTDPNGARLVRGPRMIATARTAGWNDLADLLEASGFADVPANS
jgi:hypothetical protein